MGYSCEEVKKTMNLKNISKNNKLTIFASLIMALAVVSSFSASALFYDDTRVDNIIAEEASIGGMVIGLLVGIVIAVNLMPIIANQTASLESNADLDSSEQTLVGLWTLLIIVGIMMAIIGVAL